jgi:superfamily II DNA or RNA helicase
MSIIIKVENFSDGQRELIASQLCIDKEITKKKNQRPEYVYPYRVFEKDNVTYVSLPFAWAIKTFSLKRKKRCQCDQTSWKMCASPRDHQRVVMNEALVKLNKNGSVIIAAFPGFGKTFTSIALAQKIKLRTVVLTNKIILMNQWKKSIEKFTSLKPADVIIVRPRTKKQKTSEKWRKKVEGATILIVNPLNVPKILPEIFSKVGCLIVDECHQIMSPCFSESLLWIQPRYLIGLSATPYRSDGLNDLIDIYFSSERIQRDLHKRHTVWKVQTEFVPNVTFTVDGRLDWNEIINSQAENEERNLLIIRLVEALNVRKILILTKRIQHAENLTNILLKRGVNVDSIYGTKKQWKKNAKVLVGTSQKIGVGFDESSLDCLILASDVEAYFIQYLGRVFRKQTVEPIIVDLVDNNPVLKKHWRTRRDVYMKHGGSIKCVTSKNVLQKMTAKPRSIVQYLKKKKKSVF